ncbi:MAG: glycosyltransferase family 2 protein [Spirulina sp. SIO3F2]|nr:glycosyltransferase family 2 protein [Spirulina sp. SIO3F2]
MNSPATTANLWVIIPARNEETTIASVIQSLQAQGIDHILVVDNGSDDRTAERATRAGATVIAEPQPGYGQACWQGIQHLPPEAAWVLFCDADGSDDRSQIPTFLQATEHADLIIGDRRATATGRSNLTPVQNFGNGLATTLIHWGWGQVQHDLGPMRLIQRAALEQLQLRDRAFGWTVEMQVRAIEAGLNITEIPVNYHPRQGGQSKISGTIRGSIQAGITILSTLAWLAVQRAVRSDPSSQSATEGKSWTASNQMIESLGIGNLAIFSALLVLLGCAIALPFGDFRIAGTVYRFWVGMGLVGIGWLFAGQLRAIAAWLFWGVTLGSRILLLPMYPGDDVWRYLWEGYIQTFGFSPYHFAPTAPELEALRTDWWPLINHPSVSAIYPPITQTGFHALASITPSVWLFKLAFIAADLLICWLLCRRYGRTRTLLYAWNPLILYSFAGGAHYDAWFLLPLVAAWLVWDGLTADRPLTPKRCYWAAALLGVSIAIKWMSVPILAFLVWRSLRQFGFKFAVGVGLIGFLPMLMSAAPFCRPTSCPLIPTSSTFVRFGRSAELVPYWVAQMVPESNWHNWLYLFPLALIVLWLLFRAKTLGQFSQWYLIGLLVVSPIIHAWYFTWAIPFAVASRNLGIRLVSLSAFVYFILQQQMAVGNWNWYLNSWERSLLWGPMLAGLVISATQASLRSGEFRSLGQSLASLQYRTKKQKSPETLMNN